MLIDTHAHLDDRQLLPQVDDVLSRARDAGVERVITIGVDLATSAAAVDLARRPGVSATVGVHPHEADAVAGETMDALRRLAARPGVVGLGETGLDYFRDRSPRPAQRAAFELHLALAVELDLPVVVHCRDAWADCLAILEARACPRLRGVAHCFSGDGDAVARLTEIGFYVSFAGNVTYKNARPLRQAAGAAPLDRLLVETDCPYLSPEPHRGKRPNEPARVVDTAACLAERLGLPLSDLASATTANAERLFGLV